MRYVDEENYNNEIKDAINSSIASFNVDGINVSDDEKRVLENKLLNNKNIKLLLKKRNQKGRRDNNE